MTSTPPDDDDRTPPTSPMIIGVVGATGTGKSALALALAEELGGEVVNADAMQLYRGMDVGTAKLTLAERRGIPHHQLDVLEVTDEASVAAYQRHARADIAAIQGRGRHPIVVGGSGLYVRAALDHLDIPPTDPAVRAGLEAEADRIGTPALHAALVARDPAAASAIEPNNTRRIVRALEVIELTGRPFSATMPRRRFVAPTVLIGLTLDRTVLDERLAERVHRMWRDGMLDEVAALVPQGLRDGRTASRALGYSQALAELDGVLTRDEAQADTIRATRRYARRQESWFRPDERTTWFDVGPGAGSGTADLGSGTADPGPGNAGVGSSAGPIDARLVRAVLARVRAAIADNGRHD